MNRRRPTHAIPSHPFWKKASRFALPTAAILLGIVALGTMVDPLRADSEEAANIYTKEEGDRKAERWKALIKERLDQRNAHMDLDPGDSIRASFEERKIIDELDQFTVVEEKGIPLRDVLTNLATRHHISIVLDQVAIEEADLSLENKIDVSLGREDKAVRLREVLPLLLDPEGLAYDIEDDALKITSRQNLERWTVTRAYAIPKIEHLAERKELAEHLRALLLAKETHRIARASQRSQEDPSEDEPEMQFTPSPTIEVFEDRVLIHAPVADHKELQELLRLIYLDL